VNCVGDESASEEEAEVCVVEWVDNPRDKLISCSFLKPSTGKKDEVKYTFDVSKCDRLFDVLVWGGVIRLTKGHVVPSADQLAIVNGLTHTLTQLMNVTTFVDRYNQL
jgi:hypothetical protein